MTAANFQSCLDFTLQQEGSWSEDPNDPGGATLNGITLETYRAFVANPDATKDDLHAMTLTTRDTIYALRYWAPVSGDDLPSGLDLMTFDMGVNAGVSRSAELLQRVVGAYVDGKIGPHTLKAVEAIPISTLIPALADAQRAYYRSLAQFPLYGNGWLARVDRREAAALTMIATTQEPIP